MSKSNTGNTAYRASKSAQQDPAQPARLAYAAGHYNQAEVDAQTIIRQDVHSHDIRRRERAAFARQVQAYCAARRHDLPLAQERFALLRQEAAALPDKGKPQAGIGQVEPTLEEEAAYQHAVCTGALGNNKAAEAEYMSFMTGYPQSPLVQGAVQRIARFHGGNVPSAAEAVWRQAEQTTQRHEQAQAREASLCGPECLAELLRRRDGTADMHVLAVEMGTTDQGTTLAAMGEAAKTHGFQPQGLALTQKGLAEQKLPVVALVKPGHYVLVEAVSPAQVTIWDPDAHGTGKGDQRKLPLAEWNRLWRGMAVALTPITTPVQTAQK